jgi:hypothetical protein
VRLLATTELMAGVGENRVRHRSGADTGCGGPVVMEARDWAP